ncbi:MAG: hypothetical protein NTX73_05475 [Rhodobacterales bacterium]|jgi:hypothetical protein|nr:hypothetical protein [Rhodobacterales bacterium]
MMTYKTPLMAAAGLAALLLISGCSEEDGNPYSNLISCESWLVMPPGPRGVAINDVRSTAQNRAIQLSIAFPATNSEIEAIIDAGCQATPDADILSAVGL